MTVDDEIKKHLADAAATLAELIKRDAQRDVEYAKWKEEAAKREAEWVAAAARSKAALEEEQRKTEKSLRELSQNIGGLSRSFGGFTECLSFPSVDRILREQFGAVDTGSDRRRRGDKSLQLDVWGFSNSNGKHGKVWVAEVKSHLTKECIGQLRNQLHQFPKFYPEHRDKELYGVLVGVKIDDDIPNLARKAGFYLISVHDELFKLDSPKGFVPKSYRVAPSSNGKGHSN